MVFKASGLDEVTQGVSVKKGGIRDTSTFRGRREDKAYPVKKNEMCFREVGEPRKSGEVKKAFHMAAYFLKPAWKLPAHQGSPSPSLRELQLIT